MLLKAAAGFQDHRRVVFYIRGVDGAVASKGKCRRRLSFRKEKDYLQARGSSFEAVPVKGSLPYFLHTFLGPIMLWRISKIKTIQKCESRLKQTHLEKLISFW